MMGGPMGWPMGGQMGGQMGRQMGRQMGGPRGRPQQEMAYGPGMGRPMQDMPYRSPNSQGSQPQQMGYGPEGMMEIDTRAKQAPYGPTFGTRNTVRSEQQSSTYQPQDTDRTHQPQGPAGPATSGRRQNNMASAHHVPTRALYSIGVETPIKGKEKEYEEWKEAMKDEEGYEEEQDGPQVSPDGAPFSPSPGGSAMPLINDLPALLARAAELEAQIVPEHMSAETVRQRANALFLQHMSEIDVTAEIQPDLDKIRAECLKIVEKQVSGGGNAKIERMRATRSAMIEVALDFADAIAALDDMPGGRGPAQGPPPGVRRPPEPDARATGSGFGGEPSGFGVESAIPGREAEYKGSGGGGGGSPGAAYSTPEVDTNRGNKSPGISNNFYDLSTADFKKPHGMRKRGKK